MTLTVSLDEVPEVMAQRLQARAAMNQRSLESEVLAILRDAVAEPQQPPTGPDAVQAKVRALGIQTPSDSVGIIRADRDGR